MIKKILYLLGIFGLASIAYASVTILPVTQGGTGTGYPTGFSPNSIITSGISTTSPLIATSSNPLWVTNITATSTTATSTFKGNVLISPVSTGPNYGFNSWQNFEVIGNTNNPFQIDTDNQSTGAQALSCDFVGNDKIVNNGFSSQYYGGICIAGSNYNTPGANAVRPNGMASFASDGPYSFGSAATNAASSTVFIQAGQGLDISYDAAFAGGLGNFVIGTTTLRTINGIANYALSTAYNNAKIWVSSSTIPQLALEGADTDNILNFREIGNNFYIATSSPTTYATSSVSELLLDANGLLTLPSYSGVGCAQFTSVGLLTNTGVACGTGGGGSSFPFTAFPNYNATSTAIDFRAGMFSTASSTFNSSLFLSNLSQGFLFTGSNGFVSSVASSSVNLSGFNNDLANLTATNASLTFSGSYNGSVARTVGLNVANANTWTALQSFFANASSTGESSNYAFFGGTATTSINNVGTVNLPTNGNITTGGLNATSTIILTAIGGVSSSWASTTVTGPTQVEFNTNHVNTFVLDFATSTTKSGCATWNVTMPSSYDGTSMQAQVGYTATTSSGAPLFGISAGSYADNSTLDTALSATTTFTSTANASNKYSVTAKSASFTPANAVAGSQLVVFQICRVVSPLDTFGASVRFMQAKIEYKKRYYSDQ